MGSFSDYLEDAILDHLLKGTAYTQPTSLHVGLSTATIVDGTTGSTVVEPASNYGRINHDSWDVAAARATENTGTITFATAAASWGTITDFFVADAATLGEILCYGVLTTSRAIGADDTARFEDGTIDVSFNTGAFSNYLTNALLDHVFKNTAFSQPTNLYCALATASIGDADTGSTLTEPASNYARKLHNAWDASSGGASENTGALTFVESTGAWGTISDAALVDALTVGNLLVYNGVDASKSVSSGETAEFAAGAFDITLA